MIIQHSITAINTQRQLGITTKSKAKSAEKLSSGYRIVRAADDAAGLAISEKMRRQIRGLTQASENIQDGVSLCQVADGYLNEVHEMIQRMNELAVKAANDTLTSTDRGYIDNEVQALKEEVNRIFQTASFNEILLFQPSRYVPEISSSPALYDTKLFYSGPGVIGGLEFNNIRYNIAELQAKGLQIDGNGVATADQEVEFDLYDGERVCLKLSAGDSLADVKRNYDWKADSTGIYVNNKLAATWSDMGIVGDGSDNGKHSFDYHGINVEINVTPGDSLGTIIGEINGANASEPVSWDISISGFSDEKAAAVSESSTYIQVTSANKNVINDSFVLSANSQGLAVKDLNTGAVSSRTSWSSFRNIGGSLDKDTTGSGYPIVDWGLDIDSNDASQITFDSEATYHFKNSDSRVPVEFDFKLSDVSSQADVISALDGTIFTGQIDSPATLTHGRASDGSSFSISNTNITQGNSDTAFELQRLYGRSFSDNYASDKLTGSITWSKERSAITNERSSKGSESTSSGGSSQTENYIYVQSDSDPDQYYILKKSDHSQTTHVAYNTEKSWTETDKITYNVTLGTASMRSGSEIVTLNMAQTDRTTLDRITTYSTYSSLDTTTSFSRAQLEASGVNMSSATIISESSYNSNKNTLYNTGQRYNQQTTDSNISTTTITAAHLTNSGTLNHTQQFIATGDSTSRSAFSFSHQISYATIAANNSGSASLTLTPTSVASRTLALISGNLTVSAASFANIELVLPEKHLVIQAGSENEDSNLIHLRWSQMNLTTAGLSSVDTLTAEDARSSIGEVKQALTIISALRSRFGSYQNQMEHAIKNVDNVVENTQASASIIRDADMAKEISKFRNQDILAQLGQQMLAQANQSREGVLSLLQ